MKCKEVMTLFSEYYDNELIQEISSEVKKHLSICEGCKSEYETFKKGVQLIKRLKPLDVSRS
ncbi:MAG: zf-HC2 domain-containing protein [Candidatus Aminicenantes bacterium]|nr:MAG: zf-HC2 domain-containing protein [Candidatus Aminicenantes bacterium]